MARPWKNQCAGPVGALYDLWIERERLARVVGGTLWGIDPRPMYASMRRAISTAPDGSTILDVPCGGGVALRALEPGRRVRYVASDLDEDMLERTRARAQKQGLTQVELVAADMRQMPFDDGMADLGLSYSGLHMIPDPDAALVELVRCLRPGAEVVGTTFLADGGLRQRTIFGLGRRRGDTVPEGTTADLRRWLEAAGVRDVKIEGSGFVLFRGRKAGGLTHSRA